MDLPDTVYYDCNIVNNDQSGTKPPPRIVFSDIRSIPILTSPELYQVSVIRFSLETANSLPIWIPMIQLGSQYNDPNLTTYSFTLTYNYEGQVFSGNQIYMQYIPTNRSEPIPSPNTLEDVHIPYYYVYSYQTIVDMMNNTLIEAFQGLKNDVGLYGINLPSNNVPFFEWDMNNSKFILSADMVSFDSTLNNHIEIHCNSALFTFISSFNAYFNGSNVVESKNYTFKLKKDPRLLNIYKISATYSVIQSYQDYECASLFSPITSIVFSTLTLPVLPANVAKPIIINGDGSLVVSGINNNISAMITDFQSDGSPFAFNGVLSYLPQSEYRMIDLNNSSSEKISNIDISIYWKDSYGNLHPMFLNSGCHCDIKLMFRKKKGI